MRAATGGEGVDAAIDCAGKEAGLELCLDAVRMGGTVGLKSTVGKGSEFWIELPAAPAAPTTHARRG